MSPSFMLFFFIKLYHPVPVLDKQEYSFEVREILNFAMEDTPESEIKKFPWQTKAILKHYSLSENAKNEDIRVYSYKIHCFTRIIITLLNLTFFSKNKKVFRQLKGLIFFIFFYLQSTEAQGFNQYSIETVLQYDPQTTLQRGPRPRFKPGTVIQRQVP